MRARIVRIVLALALLLVLVGQQLTGWHGGGSPPIARAAAGDLTVTPSSGPPNTTGYTISIAPGSFGNGSAVTISFTDSNSNVTASLASGTAATDGSLTLNNVSLPSDATAGTAHLNAAGSGGLGHATGTFTVVPSLNISPTHAPVNTTLNLAISGKGFGPTDTVNFSVAGTQLSATTTTNGVGSFSTTISVSTGANAGTINITATDAKATQTVQFTVDPASGSTATLTPTQTPTGTLTPTGGGLTINPASGPPSISGGAQTTVTVSAPTNYFPANSPATVLFTDSSNTHTTLSTSATVDSSGNFSATVTIPSNASGGNATITVIAGGKSLSGTFKVTPVMVATPTTVQPGGTLTINGYGFTPSKVITFNLGGTTPIQATTTVATDPHGTFTASIVIPSTTPQGANFITASDGTTALPQALVQFTVGTPTATPTATSSVSATPTSTPTATGTPPTATPTNTPVGQTIVTTAYFAEGYTGLASTNGKATFSEVLNILNPGSTAASVTITYYVQGAAAPQVVTRQIPPTTVLREPVNADVGSDKFVAAVVTSPQHLVVSRTISRVSAAGTRLDGSTTQPAGAPATSWAFPEGYTGITFQEYLSLLNTSNVPASVQVLLAPQATTSAGAHTLTVTVAPQGRFTVNIRALNLNNSAKSVGMIITSNVPIVAERVEYFGDGVGSGKFGSTVSKGFTAGATEMRIPYGTSGGAAPDSHGVQQPVGDQGYVTLLNPASSGGAAHVTVGFTDSAGHQLGQPVIRDINPGTRQTVVANVALGPTAAGPFSISISSSLPIVAELAQYTGGSPNIGLHPGVAIPAFSGALTDGFLSELSTQQIDAAPVKRTAYIYNPGGSPIQVSATYFGATGTTAQATYNVPAGGIATVNVNQDIQSTIPAGPVGAEYKLAAGSGGSFIVAGIGQTVDGLSVTEDVSATLP